MRVAGVFDLEGRGQGRFRQFIAFLPNTDRLSNYPARQTAKRSGFFEIIAIDQAHKAKKPYKIEKVLPNYPNTKRHAEAFVDAVFGDYLKKS